MKKCKINTLDAHIDIETLVQSFIIVRFTSSDRYLSYDAFILDEISAELKAKSIVFERGKSFFALFDKAIADKLDISFQLQKLENASSLSFQIMENRNISNIPKHTLIQLLINSIATPAHKRLSFNNLTGRLFLFDPARFQSIGKQEHEQLLKIVALELKVSPDLSLNLNVTTFSHVKLRNHMDFSQSKRKFNHLAQYAYVPATQSLRRVSKTQKTKHSDDLFVIRQTKKKGKIQKNTIEFLNFNSLEEFNQSRVGILNQALMNIDEKLSRCLTLNFADVSIVDTVRFSNSFDFAGFNEQVNIVDYIKDENSTACIGEIMSSIQAEVPNAKVKHLKQESKKGYNIRLIHNKSYYEKYHLSDPYSPKASVQHITFEDFRATRATVKNVIKELIIKHDIKQRKVNIVDWNAYGFAHAWVFVIKEKHRFFLMEIQPNALIKFEEFVPSLFNQSEYGDLCRIFDEQKDVECLIKDDKGNINFIQTTNGFSLPEFQKLHTLLYEEAQPIRLSKEKAIQTIKQVSNFKVNQSDIIHQIEHVRKKDWSKTSLLTCFSNRKDKQKFVEAVFESTGEVLKTYLRGASRFELVDSQLDIHTFQKNDERFYFVGVKNQGIRTNMPKASVIRKITAYEESMYLFDELLPLMNVDFVKNGDLTVLPFPMKYLREWVAMLPNK